MCWMNARHLVPDGQQPRSTANVRRGNVSASSVVDKRNFNMMISFAVKEVMKIVVVWYENLRV